ncbi:MAG: DUF4130 domain-containing protein [Candidatus Thermoplasmatota archaeon]|nr:DUF4130 domain-containing protein [Candidatus Thermoplasmatota archaeon]
MLVLFRQSPRSVITAHLASRVHNAKPVLDDSRKQFFFEETLDADTIDYDGIYTEFKEKFGGMDFLEDVKLYEIIEDEIFWATRFNTPDRYFLIFNILSQIESSGTRAYLSQSSPEAKEMKDRIRRVSGEFRRARGVISFEEDEKAKTLIGRGSFEHEITDLVLRYQAMRRPGYKIAIVGKEDVHILVHDDIVIDSRNRFPEKQTRKDARRYWTIILNPKNVESKRDPRYLVDRLPRNYWKWVSEGAQEAERPPKVTLDDFDHGNGPQSNES